MLAVALANESGASRLSSSSKTLIRRNTLNLYVVDFCFNGVICKQGTATTPSLVVVDVLRESLREITRPAITIMRVYTGSI